MQFHLSVSSVIERANRLATAKPDTAQQCSIDHDLLGILSKNGELSFLLLITASNVLLRGG